MPGRRAVRIACAAGLACLVAGGAQAESGLLLAYPASFGAIPAATYDASGKRVGGARLEVERLDDGRVRLLSESGIAGGARTIATALLAPTADGRSLRLQVEESRSFDPAGAAMGVLRIDHHTGVATCTSADGKSVDHVDLPKADRVANVPFNLLFLPLIRGDLESLSFQFVLCNGGARYIDFEAHVERHDDGSGGAHHIVEVRYGPRLGRLVSMIAQSFVPKLSFWFDPQARDPWIGHRLPLYSKGPEVMVVRDGVSTASLEPE